MGQTIRFGGRPKTLRVATPAARAQNSKLEEVLGALSWKYVKREAEFDPDRSVTDVPPDELKENMAHWAGRVWSHSNPIPVGHAVRAFELMSLEGEYRSYIAAHGTGLFEEGMSIEEIWASQQLFSGSPMLVCFSPRYAEQVAQRIEPQRAQNSQSMVWVLGALSLQLPQLLQGGGFNVLVTDGKVGHTIYIKGMNGIDFVHPRGVPVRAGWFSIHDPWPARSLLAPERNFNGVQLLEDVTRPPLWLISPEDLDKVLVGYLLPVDALRYFFDIYRTLDLVEKSHAGGRLPLWLDQSAPDPERPFSLMLRFSNNVTPTTAEGLLGLGRTRLLMRDLEGALECFEGAVNLGLPNAAREAAALLAQAGHESLAKKWARRRS